MYTKEDIMKDLEKMGVNPKGTLKIHSSLKAVGALENGADTVLDACMAYMKEGLLVFPTHTWGSINRENNIFDPEKEPSCVGILGNVFRKRKGVLRSLHPTHSVAAYGKDAEAYIRNDDTATTPCGREGCYGRLYDRPSQILFLGCSLDYNTFIHSVEEWHNIPNRISDVGVDYLIQMPDGTKRKSCVKHHDCHGVCNDVSKHYHILEPVLLTRKMAVKDTIGDAVSVLCEVKEMADLVSSFLEKKTNLFDTADEIPSEWY